MKKKIILTVWMLLFSSSLSFAGSENAHLEVPVILAGLRMIPGGGRMHDTGYLAAKKEKEKKKNENADARKQQEQKKAQEKKEKSRKKK